VCKSSAELKRQIIDGRASYQVSALNYCNELGINANQLQRRQQGCIYKKPIGMRKSYDVTKASFASKTFSMPACCRLSQRIESEPGAYFGLAVNFCLN
jgi:transposase-like protein